MKRHLCYLSAALLLSLSSCSVFRNTANTKDDQKITVSLLQINDVYEIAPLSGGKEGGMARVAALKKQLLQKNANTLLVVAGDFLSPSVYNSLPYMGKPIRGKQMVEAMNAAEMDIAIFGNHEFDIKEGELQERINESDFRWVSSNAFHNINGVIRPFTKNGEPLSEAFLMDLKDADGTTATIGFFGIVLPFNKADYVSYTDALTAAKEMYTLLSKDADAVVAITHQSMQDDEKLARELPGLAAIFGGHEHDGRFARVGNVPITKALANARSAYVVNLLVNKKTKRTKTETELIIVNEKIPLDSATNAVVEKWNDIAEKNYSSLGFDAKKVVIKNGDPLDGRETEVRRHPTNLTKLIVSAIQQAAPKADVILVNGGSIRVDDILYPPITQYDILRTLPFGGGIKEADVKGSLLLKVLEAGRRNINIGGFLQYNDNLKFDAGSSQWLLNNLPIDPAKSYRIAVTDFLFTGKEANLDFLNPQNPEVFKVYDSTTPAMSDIRMAIVQYLETHPQ